VRRLRGEISSRFWMQIIFDSISALRLRFRIKF
jgi:hypothetical protein